MPLRTSSSTGVTITNPLVLYRALIATKRIDPDPAQHRLALHLQKLYEQLKDYEPIVQYGHRLQQLTRTLGQTNHEQGITGSNNGLRKSPPSRGLFSSILDPKKERNSLALTRVLTDHQAAKEIDSPRGLMLHGEVGTGKSMLIDLFADCLPNKKKKRWHFTTFMLETISKLEHLRRSRQVIIPDSLGQADEYSLLWLARDMISTSPILFLDEFQLPDRAASKLMSNLMTSFFHLGGVLIATSNRMPEELAKAAGIEFTPPPSQMGSIRWNVGLPKRLFATREASSFSGHGEFAGFLEVIRARCEIWEMDGKRDYRRREAEDSYKTTQAEPEGASSDPRGFDGLQPIITGNIGLGFEQSANINITEKEAANISQALPKNFFVRKASEDYCVYIESWNRACREVVLAALAAKGVTQISNINWSQGTIRVYGRDVLVPRQNNGISSWTFDELCASTLGPADYISLASRFHTFILSDVPVLTILKKNEARRFITLLDALYEARCKLLISAEAGPDDLFFPEVSTRSPEIPTTPTSGDSSESDVNDDPVYPETFSEIFQDATAPFRPNVSMYDASTSEPDYTHARLQGILSDDQLEDDPPNKIHRGETTHRPYQDVVRTSPDFARTGTFTGEDERFAYKRAKSRLWEMCGASWWARNEDGWWKPIDKSVRHWEKTRVSDVVIEPEGSTVDKTRLVQLDAIGPCRDIDEKKDEVLFRHGGVSPFRKHQDPPPKFAWTHIWGMMKWGKKAGAWGQGVDGLMDRPRRKP